MTSCAGGAGLHACQPHSTPTKAEILRELVDRVVFHNEENGYCILKAVPEGKRDVVSLIGRAPGLVAGAQRCTRLDGLR